MAVDINIPNPNKTVMTFFSHNRFNPAINATYYFATVPNPSPQTAENFGSSQSPDNFTVKKIRGVVTGSAGSAHDVSFYLTVDGVDHLIETVQLTATRTLVGNGSMNVAVTENQKMSIKMVCPPWTTAPINVTASFNTSMV
jgi:hypothetical protein